MPAISPQPAHGFLLRLATTSRHNWARCDTDLAPSREYPLLPFFLFLSSSSGKSAGDGRTNLAGLEPLLIEPG